MIWRPGDLLLDADRFMIQSSIAQSGLLEAIRLFDAAKCADWRAVSLADVEESLASMRRQQSQAIERLEDSFTRYKSAAEAVIVSVRAEDRAKAMIDSEVLRTAYTELRR